MKKLGILLFTLVALVALAWLGLTFVFSNSVESWIDQGLAKANEEMGEVQISKTGFKKGFFSSETSTAVTGVALNEVAQNEKGVEMKHQIFHGPIAMTPGGPKFCQTYVITTLDRTNWKPKTLESVQKSFGDKEPVTILTERSYTGEEKVRATVESFSIDDEEMTVEFGGALFTAKGKSTAGTAKGDLRVSSLSFGSKEDQPMSGSLGESSGQFDFQDEGHLTGTMSLGEFQLSFPDEKGKSTVVNLDSGSAKVDMAAGGPENQLWLGKSKVTFPTCKISGPEFAADMKNFVVDTASGENAGKLEGMLTYSVESLESPQLAAKVGGADLSIAFPLSLSTNYAGIDANAALAVSEGMEKMQAAQSKAKPGTSPDIDSAVVDSITDNLFEFFGPGLSMGLAVGFGGADPSANVFADLDLDMKGTKKLTEMTTGKEILNAIEVKLDLNASEDALQHPLLAQYLAQMQMMGIGKRNAGGGIEAKARIIKGALTIDDKAFPLPIMQMMEPKLNQPIAWESIIGMVKMAIRANAAGGAGLPGGQ